MGLDRKAYNKAYYEANREKLKASSKAYREANREKIKACRKAYYEANREEIIAKEKAYYEANRENFLVYKKAYYEANREKFLVYKKAYYEANREEVRTSNKAYHKANREKIKARKKVHYEANREKVIAKAQVYRKSNREKVNSYHNKYIKDRCHRDPIFKLAHTYRSTISRGFKSVCLKKDIKSIDCLGCSWEEFQDHIQSQFYDRAETGEKMTLENHGCYGWHLDHIIPISSAKTKENVIRLSHYTNFQPLWSEDNYEKRDNFLDNDEQIA